MADADDAPEASLLERLRRSPRLAATRQAEAQLVEATATRDAAQQSLVTACAAANAAIGEAMRHRGLLEAQQKAHRFDAPADALIARNFTDLPVHLARAFTKDVHIAFHVDQTSIWESWTPPDHPQALTATGQPGFLLRWGGYDRKGQSPLLFSALPLIGGGRPWIILSDEASTERARDLLRALTLRIACMLPQQSRFTFLDPLHYGQTFPMQRYLPSVRETTGDLAQDLQPIQADVRRIIRDVVAFHGSFEALPAEQQANERYEFIFAADFPAAKAYDRRAAEMLLDIGRAGPKAGRYLILHVTEGAEMPHGIDFAQLGEAYRIDLRKGANAFADVPPEPALQQTLLERIRGVAPARRSADFSDVLPTREKWWTGQSARRIEATLDGQKDGLEIVFGQRDDGNELVHGVLAAAAGAGKSNLLHTLLLGLATRYPPDELRLYLMDLKQGVEFQPYVSLPHAVVVAYNTDPALARAVLSELRREMQRRYEEMFRRAGVQKLEDYRAAGAPHGPAPRVLLVVDEYQALFQGADAQEVSADLLALSTQGRAAGIHMLLGSQTFRAVGMQGSEQIFNNINIRMAMRIPAAAAQALTEFEREGKELIRACDLPGKVVLNIGAGRDGANRLGQVVLVAPDDRARVLTEMAAFAQTWPAEKRSTWPRTQVFDGSQAPPLADHPLTLVAARLGQPLDSAALAQWAVAARAAGGLGRTDWRASDRPVPLMLGREYAVHGDAACVLRRLPNQNLLVLGGSATGRMGILSGIVASALALAPEALGAVRVLDLSGDPSVTGVLATAGPRVAVTTDPSQAVAMLESPPSAASELLLLIEPDRAVNLLRPTDPLARSPATDALERRLRDGRWPGNTRCSSAPGLRRWVASSDAADPTPSRGAP